CSNAPLLRTKKSLQRAVQTRRCCVRKSLCKELFKRAAVAYEKVSAKSCSNAPLLRTKKSLQRAVQTRRCCVRKSLCKELFKRAAVAYEKVSAMSCSNAPLLRTKKSLQRAVQTKFLPFFSCNHRQILCLGRAHCRAGG